jgi:hypothetical protein
MPVPARSAALPAAVQALRESAMVLVGPGPPLGRRSGRLCIDVYHLTVSDLSAWRRLGHWDPRNMYNQPVDHRERLIPRRAGEGTI